jgi:hypothetical protein
LTALDAKTGKILWRWYTLPGPGKIGADTWPSGTDHFNRGGAAIWNTPALDPQLGLSILLSAIVGRITMVRCAKEAICSALRSSR